MAPRSERIPAWSLPLPAVLVAAGATAACAAADAGEGVRAVVRDSAGVEIVENGAPAWSAGTGWTVDPVPSMDIGAVDGAREVTFDGVRAVRRLADGGLLVAQGTELRVFDASGRHVGTFGAEGEGPGEFTLISGVEACGDRILATDFVHGTLTAFSMDGEHVGTVPLARADYATTPAIAGCMRGAPVLTVPSAGERASPPRIERRGYLVVRADLDGTLRDTLATLRSAENYEGLLVPFGRVDVFEVDDSLVHFGDTRIAEIRTATADGALLRIIRFGGTAEPVTTDVVDEVRAQYLDVPEPIAEDVRPLLDALTMPETMPFFSGLFVSPDGTIWLQGYYPLRSGTNRTWQVFAPDGAWLGPITVPEGLHVHAVTDDHLIGVWRDDLDVEHVRVHRIVR